MFPPTKLHLGNPYLWRRWSQKNKTMPLYWHFTTRSVQSMERRDCFNDKYAWSACRTHTRDQKVIDQHWDAHNIAGWRRFNFAQKWLAYVAQGRIKGTVEPPVPSPPALDHLVTENKQTPSTISISRGNLTDHPAIIKVI